jgi:hypothetical protein
MIATLSTVSALLFHASVAADNQMPIQDYATLIAKAEAQGTIRIVVRLRMEFKPEGSLPNPQAVQRQRKAISDLQDTLLNRLTSYNVVSIKRYQSIPSLTMQVDATALKALITFPEVESIREDIPMPPLGPEHSPAGK